MAATIRWAGEAQEIAQKLVNKHHRHLKEARIAYLFTSSKRTRHGRPLFATVEKLGAKARFLSGHGVSASKKDAGPFDFVVLIGDEQWEKASEERRLSMLDHELCHCTRDEGEWKIAPHDVEEFAAVLKRHGVCSPVQAAFVRALQQLELPLEAGEESGKVVPMGNSRRKAATAGD